MERLSPAFRPRITIRALFWMCKTLVVTADLDVIPQIFCIYNTSQDGLAVTIIHHLECMFWEKTGLMTETIRLK